MAERFQDVYEFNLQGNYAEELNRLQAALTEARAGFKSLADSVQTSGAKFSKTKKDYKEARDLVREFGQEAIDAGLAAGPIQEELAASADVLAQAYNQLARESNKLATARAREQIALEQLRKGTDPQIIAARAETRAIVSLNAQLEDLAFKREFAVLAAKKGLTVSADGKHLFDAEAEAAYRAAKGVERLGLAEALRKRGLDLQGNKLPEPKVDSTGALTAAGKATAEQNAQKKAAAALLKAEELQVLKNNKAYLESVKATNLAQKEISALTKVGEQTQSTFNRVSFTFRRLIGIMAAFTIARQVTSGFVNMIKTAIKFNAEIESSKIGLAGLIAASAEIRDPLGGKLGIDDQILRSQDIALDQMKKLRIEALNTAASYDDLAAAFNSAVAPGIQAGLTLDQIRDITVNISQAATGLGLAQNQLAEEIRSLFQGTITARSTRIATALGISNKDIENAKRLGTLAEFLRTRFLAISKTGRLLLDTFEGQASNTVDALKQLLAISSKPLFEELKLGFKEVQDAIFDTSSDADKIFKPDALRAFSGLFKGLANGVRGVRDAFDSIDASAFGDAFAAVGQSLGAITTSLSKGLAFFINSAAPTVTVFAGLVDVLSKSALLIKNLSGGLGTFLGTTALVIAKWIFFTKTVGVVKIALGGSLTLLTKINSAVVAAYTATKVAAVSTLSWRVALNGAWLAARRFLLPLLGIALAIAGIDTILDKLGVKFSVTDLLGKAINYASDSLDRLLGISTELKDVLDTPLQDGLGIVTEDFRNVRSELEQTKEEVVKSIDAINSAAAASFRGSNLPQAISSVISKEAEIDLKAKNQALVAQRKSLEIEGARAALIKQIDSLEKDSVIQLESQTGLVQALSEATEKEQQLATKRAAQNRIDRNTGFPGSPEERAETERQLKAVRALKEVYSNALNFSKQTIESNTKNLELSKGQLVVTKDQLEELNKINNEILASFGDEARASFRAILSDDLVQLKNRLLDLPTDIQFAEVDYSAALQSSELLVATQRAEVELQKEKIQYLKIQDSLSRGIADLESRRGLELSRSNEADLQLVTLLDQQIGARRTELAQEKELGERRIKRAAAEAKLAELREKGSVNQGIGFGLQNFAKDNASVFNTGEQFGKELGNAVPQFVGSALKTTVAAAFDKTQNVDLGAALADLGAGIALDLAANLIQNLVANLLSSLLTSIGVGVTEQLTAAGEAALTLEAGGNSAGLAISSNSEIGANIMFDGISLAGGALIADATTAAGIIGGTSTASTVAGTAALASATGGAVNKARRFNSPNLNLSHARATGYAAGGRPLGIDPRDTIPAWLRPGEWVIRPEAVRLYGDRIFDLLNRGALNPSALHGVAGAAKGPRSPVSRKVGFATGGQAVPQSGGSGRSQQVGLGQVIQFHDEQTMERALAAGPNAPVRFARARRSAYRAALGLEPGT